VLGHSNCGAVKAALAGDAVPGQISTLFQHIVPALDRKTMDLDAAIAANVRYQVRKLREASPLLAQRIAAGQLVIEGGVLDLETGTVRPVES
jgi:carbonic anhydrase